MDKARYTPLEQLPDSKHLDDLEARSIYILREAFNRFENPAMLWSVGKDSSVLLWLARKAFFGRVPFPCAHVDTGYKIPEMITFRDALAEEWGLDLVVAQPLATMGRSYPEGGATRVECC